MEDTKCEDDTDNECVAFGSCIVLTINVYTDVYNGIKTIILKTIHF